MKKNHGWEPSKEPITLRHRAASHPLVDRHHILAIGSRSTDLRGHFVTQCILMPPAALPLPARAGGLHKPQT